MNQAARIAYDALLQLKAEKLIARNMAYIRVDDDRLNDGQELTGLELGAKTCYVCAKGALVIGYMLGEQPDTPLEDLDDRMADLAGIFGSEQFDLIEACFEGFSASGVVAHNYYATFEKDVRLERILENIVRNDGQFIPWQDLA